MKSEKNKSPLVSVIVPTWNSSHFLKQALESILNQTYQNTEIIVIDDGSTDNTLECIQEYIDKIIYIKQEHSGPWKARNVAIEKASGEYIAFQDADDISNEKRLEMQINLLETNPDVGIVFGMMEEFEDKNNTITPRPGREHLPGCCPGTMLVKKEVFKEVGSFSTRWELAGFVDWLQRSKKKGIIHQMLNSNILKRRIHSSNSGAGKHELLMKEYAEVILENK